MPVNGSQVATSFNVYCTRTILRVLEGQFVHRESCDDSHNVDEEWTRGKELSVATKLVAGDSVSYFANCKWIKLVLSVEWHAGELDQFGELFS